MKEFFLSKYLVVDTEYQTDKRQVLVIKKVGTNSTSKVTLSVDGVPCLEVIQNIAPLRKTSSTIIGLLDLEEYYVVVPPETKFSFTGASGSYLNIVGSVLQLEPGENLGDPYLGRYSVQGKQYITYISDSYDHGTDTAWAADDENEVVSVTPTTIEEYVLDKLLLLEKSGGTINPRNFVLKTYIDNVPKEYIYSSSIKEGIDVLNIPAYNENSINETPFSFKELPIHLLGDHTLKFTIKNISGGSLTPDSGDSWTFTLYAVVKYHKKE